MRALGVAGLGYQWGKGSKLRSVGESLLQKSARESGEVAILATIYIIRQVK